MSGSWGQVGAIAAPVIGAVFDPQDFARRYAETWKPSTVNSQQPETRPTIDWSALPEDTPDSIKGMIAMADVWRPMMKETADMNLKNSERLLALQNEYNERGFLASAPFKLGLAGMQLAGQIASAPGYEVAGPRLLPIYDNYNRYTS